MDRGDPLQEALEQRVARRGLDDQARGGAARLPLDAGEVHAVEDGVRGTVEVGIRADDDRVLAAELQAHVLDGGVGGVTLDRAPGGGAAGEGDPPDRGVADERATAGWARADDHVEHAGCQRVAQQRPEAQGGQRRQV